MTERQRTGWMVVRFNLITKEETPETVFISKRAEEAARQFAQERLITIRSRHLPGHCNEILVLHEIHWTEKTLVTNGMGVEPGTNRKIK
jgi:hypothetical protein